MDLFKLVGRIVLDGVESAQSGLEKVSKKAQAVGSKLEAAGKKITNFGRKLAPVSAAAAGVLGVAVKSASNFEDAMAKVSTIADTSAISIAELQQQIMNLSTESGIAAADIAENVYNAISAGQKTGDAVNFVSNATQLARAGFTDSASALDILSTAMNAYGLEASEVGNVSDKLIMTQNLGKTTVAELASAMGRAIPTAKAVGVNIDQLCGSYAVMTSNGISTAETTTYLNSMLNELGKQGTTAANAFAKGTEHIQKGGLSMSEAMEMGWSLTDVLGVLNEQAEASGTSINNMFSSAEAGKAASVLSDQAEKLDSAIQQMGNSAGATEEAYKKMETTSFNVQKSLNQLKNTAITLGQTVLQMAQPLIEKFAAGVEKLSTWFNSLNSSQQETVAKILGIVAVAAPLLMVIGSIVSGIGGLITAFGGAGLAIAAINPVVLAVVAGIAALIAIGVLLYKNWDTIKAKAVEIWQNVSTTISETVSNIKEKVVSTFQNIKDGVSQKLEAIRTAIQEKFTAAKDFVVSIFTTIKDNIQSKLNEAAQLAGAALDLMVTVITKVVPNLLSSGIELITGLKDGISQGFSQIMSQVGGWVETNIISPVKEKVSGFLQIGSEFASNLWNGLTGWLSEKFPGLAKILGDGAKTAADSATTAMQGMTETAQTTAQEASTAAVETINAAGNTVDTSRNPVAVMGEAMSSDTSMSDAGTEAVNTASTDMQSAVESAGFDAAGSTATQRFIDGINSMSGAVMAAVEAIASQAVARMQSALNQIQSMASSAGGGGVPGFATGLNYVPYDNFPAMLHKGEAVLTAEEAKIWRAGKSAGNAAPATAPQQQGGSESQTVVPIVFNMTSELDGMALAQKQYKYNLIVSRNHGVSLVQGV